LQNYTLRNKEKFMYYIKKIFRMILSIFSIGTLSFLLLELIPGEPETTILGIEASVKDLENLREQLGLNLSFGWIKLSFQNKSKQGEKMEFLQLLLVLIAMIIIIAKPQKEKLAFGLIVVSWLFMAYLYIGHKSGALLTTINL